MSWSNRAQACPLLAPSLPAFTAMYLALFLRHPFCYFLIWLHRTACGFLVPQPGIEPAPHPTTPAPHWKCKVLTAGPPGRYVMAGNIFSLTKESGWGREGFQMKMVFIDWLRGMQELSSLTKDQSPLQWKCRVLVTGPPGKSLKEVVFKLQ